ncbi:MAG TPA: response regulator [Vicinamibacterales bacterium]|nr:response regulator [Vicinamibacterales bacterium]
MPGPGPAVAVPPVARDLRGSETILVVEDEDGLRRLATRILSNFGYRVLTASSGAEALRLAEEHGGSVALVMTDVVMPGMSGPEMVEALRDLAPGARILYTSGYMGDTMARHGIVQTDIAFLPKPYTPTTLLGKIRDVMGP